MSARKRLMAQARDHAQERQRQLAAEPLAVVGEGIHHLPHQPLAHWRREWTQGGFDILPVEVGLAVELANGIHVSCVYWRLEAQGAECEVQHAVQHLADGR
jgi:hypothetical protein